ncbi:MULTISPECIES: hypothetical protein [Clostridium]|uniref:Uncharacterized protein n=1 Tax=Clostridium botulinum B str. Osaka05 TaxID=1407017 RepID=A0A060N8S8_CLOBO|nr:MULTISPECIES: hypothetical protein [Clostridium]BAO04903.1 uncharacterized protein CBO05P1_184 [Clostridium botulinum B str. Osaka05]
MNKVLVIKNSNSIIISQDGKRLIIDKNNELYNQLKDLEKSEIKEWYLNR